MKRPYTTSKIARLARIKNAAKPRPGRAPATKWHCVQIPHEMYMEHKRPGEAWHTTVKRKLDRATKKGPPEPPGGPQLRTKP